MEQSNEIQQDVQPTLSTVMPAYIKERMQKARQNIPATAKETQPDENVSQDPVIEQQETPAEPSAEKQANDVSAWKGRLTKEQAEHKNTQARLLAETQARQTLEQERETAKNRISELESALAKATQPTQTDVYDEFSEEDLNDIELALGSAGKKLVERLKHGTTQQDVGKLVDEKISAERTRLNEQTKETQWQQAVMQELPDMQGLLNDPAFFHYCNETEVDFMGNNAISLINQVAKERDVGKIPKIRALIDNFKQKSKDPYESASEQVTAPPSNRSVAVSIPNKTGKKTMTAKDVAYKNRLARAGKTDELNAFLAQFK